MSHSVIFVNLSGPIIVAARFFKKEPIQTLETLGCCVAIFGSILSVFDKAAEKTNSED